MSAAHHAMRAIAFVLVDIAKTTFLVCVGNHSLALLVPFDGPVKKNKSPIPLGFQELVARLLKRFDRLRNIVEKWFTIKGSVN